MLNHYSTYSIVCQEVFQLFFSARLPSGKQPTWEATPRPSTGELVPLTDKGIIAHPVADCNRQNAQIAGFLFFVFCATFPLDKLLGPWYNGNSARAHSRPGRQKIKQKKQDLLSLAFRNEILRLCVSQKLARTNGFALGCGIDVENHILFHVDVIPRNAACV